MLPAFHSRICFGAHDYYATHGADVLFLSLDYPALAPWNELVLPKIRMGSPGTSSEDPMGYFQRNLAFSLTTIREFTEQLGK